MSYATKKNLKISAQHGIKNDNVYKIMPYFENTIEIPTIFCRNFYVTLCLASFFLIGVLF